MTVLRESVCTVCSVKFIGAFMVSGLDLEREISEGQKTAKCGGYDQNLGRTFCKTERHGVYI